MTYDIAHIQDSLGDTLSIHCSTDLNDLEPRVYLEWEPGLQDFAFTPSQAIDVANALLLAASKFNGAP